MPHMRPLLALLLLTAAPLAAQSLFTDRTLDEGSLYADQVARQVGDLVTIRVVETMSVEEKAETKRERDNEARITLNQLPRSTKGGSTAGLDPAEFLPGLNVGSEKEFEGKGEAKSSGRMSLTLSARVMDTLDNGNLVIEARRTLTVNDDTKTVLLTGICRRADITQDNVVLSTSMHGFEVSIVGEGPLSRSQQEGWLGRLLDAVWPF
jgi:flagellar L-ring protein FlgH